MVGNSRSDGENRTVAITGEIQAFLKEQYTVRPKFVQVVNRQNHAEESTDAYREADDVLVEMIETIRRSLDWDPVEDFDIVGEFEVYGDGRWEFDQHEPPYENDAPDPIGEQEA